MVSFTNFMPDSGNKLPKKQRPPSNRTNTEQNPNKDRTETEQKANKTELPFFL